MSLTPKRAYRAGQAVGLKRNRTLAAVNGGERRSPCGAVQCRPGLLLAQEWLEEQAKAEAQAYETEHEKHDLAIQGISAPSYIGAGCTSTFTPLPGRGGPKNWANRVSTALSEADLRKLADATAFAQEAGLAFNRHTTIHWGAARVVDPLRATGCFLKMLGEAVRAAGGSFAYVWVRENGDGKGEHVHILWHGPAELPVFKRRVQGWLRRCGARRAPRVTKTVSIAGGLGAAGTGSAHYRANLGTVLDYLSKGGDHLARARLGIRHNEPGGPIVGKRCGTSENIGRMARARPETRRGPVLLGGAKSSDFERGIFKGL